MKKKLLFALVLLLVVAALPISASAELGIKPVADPWDDPNNLIKDGAVYTAYNEDGYIVAWETPECDVNGKYMLIKNDTELKVEYRVSYMGDVPWGHVTVKNDGDEDFAGWVLMSDLLGADGKPAAEAPVKIPDHPDDSGSYARTERGAGKPRGNAYAHCPGSPGAGDKHKQHI